MAYYTILTDGAERDEHTLNREESRENIDTTVADAAEGKARGLGTGAFRTRRLGYAVVTSVSSKVASIAVQLLALPIAINALGAEKYGVFVTLSAALMWLSIANMGLSPGLTRGIAISVANADRTSERRYFSSAFFLIFGVAFLLLTFLAVVWWSVPVETLFGNEYSMYSDEVRGGLLLLGLLLTLTLALSVVDAARAGYQEQYANNLSTTLGNTLSIVLLFVVAYYWPTIAGMIVAIYGMYVLAQLLNGFHLIWLSRPYLVPRLDHFDFGLCKMLFGTGLAFVLVWISSYINQQLSLFLVGRQLGPDSAASFAVMLRMTDLLGSVVIMFTLPLWPAITDAMARGEISWVRSSYRKLVLLSTCYAIVAGGLIAVAGQPIVRLWIGPEVLPTGLLQGFIGLYFVLVMWTHVHYMTLVGLGRLWAPAIVLLMESVVMVPLALWFIYSMHSAGVAAALCLSTVGLGVWLLPIMVKTALKQV